MHGSSPVTADPDARWLGPVMHSAFLLLLGASLARFLTRHPGEPRTPWVIALSGLLAAVYLLGPVTSSRPYRAMTGGGGTGPLSYEAVTGDDRPGPETHRTVTGDDRSGPGVPGPAGEGPADRPGRRWRMVLPRRTDRTGRTVLRRRTDRTWRSGPGWRTGRPALVVAVLVTVWAVLVLLAPSFAWCAVPFVYTGLRTLPVRAALPLVALLTVFVVVAQLRLAGGFDPGTVLAPPAVAAIATAMFLHMERQAARQRSLIADLLRTRRELAATERREGTLAERQRLSMEIHDTLAQGLSSQRMLLQAADRTWDLDPATARGHVRRAAEIAAHNLAEARRFVHDLAPADLAGGVPLHTALAELAEREGRAGPAVRFRLDGTPQPLPDRVQSALLRVAQGALANVREHSGATTAVLTLSCLDDQVVLDITDDGRGFDPDAVAARATAPPGGTGTPGGVRGGDGPDAGRTAGVRPGGAPGSGGAAGDAPDGGSAAGSRAAGSPTGDGPGDGGPPDGPAGGRGHGLPAMRARLAQLGGTLTVESAPGEGTVLSAAVPLTSL